MNGLFSGARVALVVAALLGGCGSEAAQAPAAQAQAQAPRPERVETAVFAGGCFWCTESDFEHLPGVIEAVSGYTGGHTRNPTYRQVTLGDTGHYEAVKVTYDPAQVSYADLARHFFRTVDPTDAGGQFCDRGESYRTAVFVAGADQRRAAEEAKAEANRTLGGRVVTPILPARAFYDAEAEHQDYYKRNSVRYRYYRWSCGRDARLRELWGN